uniref:Uncharacterized protein LOC116296675 n=1 Tax=Actinia tenebrosa TaxID=6105 RepID=A0A6P8HZ71_ACTTE
MVVPTDDQSEEEVKGTILAIKQEWKKTRKDHGNIKEMMNRTYAKRREMVPIEQQPLKEIVNMFPPVQSMLYIKADFARVMGNPDLTTQMKSSFKDVWSCRTLSYAKKNSKHEKIFLEMTAVIDSGCQEEEFKERSALKLASMILRPPNRKGIQNKDHEEAVIKVIPDHQSLDEAIKGLRQPVIIVANDLYNSDLMYVAAEGMLFSTITTNKIADAIVGKNILFFRKNLNGCHR